MSQQDEETREKSSNDPQTSDSDNMRLYYEGVIKNDPQNLEAVHYLGLWHLERQSFKQAKKFFGHLTSLIPEDPDSWICLNIASTMSGDFNESTNALKRATAYIESPSSDIRLNYCKALQLEKKKDLVQALDIYLKCLQFCARITVNQAVGSDSAGTSKNQSVSMKNYARDMTHEVKLRMAIIKKDTGYLDQALSICNNILAESPTDGVHANALCLKGVINEIKADFPSAEVAYRSALYVVHSHVTALERLGRVYLRYRETIPAAVQCFFKSLETNPSNYMSWYLLGRCYMATAQYTDACEAYNRAVNLNPNDPQIWCSLGVLYYAYGQYTEALGMFGRALKLDHTIGDAWYNVGALYDMVDQPDDAQQAYLKAREWGVTVSVDRDGFPSMVPEVSDHLQRNKDECSILRSSQDQLTQYILHNPDEDFAKVTQASAKSSYPFHQQTQGPPQSNILANQGFLPNEYYSSEPAISQQTSTQSSQLPLAAYQPYTQYEQWNQGYQSRDRDSAPLSSSSYLLGDNRIQNMDAYNSSAGVPSQTRGPILPSYYPSESSSSRPNHLNGF